jgi:pSer/pThr/pTyr-binding forkhead associated (FHA) protein
MALRIVVVSAPSPEGASDTAHEASALAFDTPRLVIGRGDGCDVRLPDPSVSHRHCSIRQRGAEYVLVDEGSTNGTFAFRTRLVAQTSHTIHSGDLVRVGRVWLELRVDSMPVMHSPAAAAKELAIRLVTAGLAAQGEDGRPRVTVQEGPDAGRQLILAEPGRRYVAGRGKDTDWVLEDEKASRKHVGFEVRGEHVVVVDLGSKGGTLLDDAIVVTDGSVWRPGQVVTVASNRMILEYAALEALGDLERCPDERLRPDEQLDPPVRGAKPPEVDGAGAGDESSETPAAPSVAEAALEATVSGVPADRRWGVLEAFVVLIAIGILAASAVGLWLLLRP